MAYVAVKGGERAIDAAHGWLAEERRGDVSVPALSVAQIEQQLGRSVDRVMAEGSLYDRELAALAIKQAQGDLIEAAFLLRAYRTTLPRFAHSRPVETAAMRIERRVSAIFKDLPGGQVLGPTYDYTHRLLDFSLMDEGAVAPGASGDVDTAAMPRVPDILGHEGLLEGDVVAEGEPGDLTREPLAFPAMGACFLTRNGGRRGHWRSEQRKVCRSRRRCGLPCWIRGLTISAFGSDIHPSSWETQGAIKNRVMIYLPVLLPD